MPYISLPHPDESRFGDVFRAEIHQNSRKIILEEEFEKYKFGSELFEKQTNKQTNNDSNKQFIIKGKDDIYRRALLRTLTGMTHWYDS